MSYTFLQGQEEAFSEGFCWDTDPYVPWKLSHTAGEYYCSGKEKGFSRGSQSGMMCKPLMEGHGGESRISCAGDSPAKISPPPEDQTERASTESEADCGQKWRGSFARWSRHSYLWKILQPSLLGVSEKFCGIWPKWGLMQDGECFLLPILAHDMSVKESGLWGRIGTPIKTQRSRSEKFSKGRVKNPYELCPPGWLPNPRWVERLMGWPDGWTDLKPLEMGKFRRWLHTHGES